MCPSVQPGTAVLGTCEPETLLAPCQHWRNIQNVLLVIVSLGEELFLRVLRKTNYGEPSTSTTPRFIRTLAKR